MKLKNGLILRKVANQYFIVPVGSRANDVSGMVYISSSAAYLFDYMKDNEFTVSDLVDRIVSYYDDVSRDAAEKDINKFLEVLKESNLLKSPDNEKRGFVKVVVKDDRK